MKRTKFLRILLIAFAFPTLCWSQSPSIVQGKIYDKDYMDGLPGARIEIQNTSTVSVSDLQGNYKIRVTDSVAILKVSYLGYNDTTVEIPVTGDIVSYNIGMASSIEMNDVIEVTITRQLQGQAKALNIQKNADNIKNVISSEQMGRFPDQNSAEALRRVSGVNTQTDQGEGRYVLIRGLAPQFTNINVNGEQIPSPEADVRFVALDAISSQQLASMEVHKTLTPDMDGDAIGGTVNLITRTATDSILHINGSLAGGYNNLMQEPNMNGQLQLDRRFGKKEQLGVLVNANYFVNNFGSDNWEREPFDNELELRDYQLTRTRTGLGATIDYKWNETSSIYLRGLFSGMTDKEWRRRYIFKPEDDEIERTTKDRFEEQSVTAVNLGGEHHLKWIEFDYQVQYSYGEQDTPYDNEASFVSGTSSSLQFNGAQYPTLSADGYLDNSSYEFDELETGNTIAKDRNLTGKFNIGLPYKINNHDGIVKFGSKVRLKEKSYSITQNKFGQLGGVPNLNSFEGGLLDDNFLNGEYTLASPFDVNKLIEYYNSNPEQFELEIEDKAVDEALEAYKATENVYAGYLMAKQRVKKWVVIGGIRYEYTKVDYESKDVVFGGDGDLSAINDISGSTDYGFFLPQVNVKYELNKLTNLRAAVTYSYARPNFSSIVPSQEANLQDQEATVGNPNLEPVSAFNLDFLGERYFGNVGVLQGGVFYKKLNDFIYTRTIQNSQYPLIGTPIATGIAVNQSQNGEVAHVAGFEFSFQRKLDFLPTVLKPLTLYTNYTYTYSRSKIQNRASSDDISNNFENIRLPGQAKHIGNISLAYQTDKFNVRISALFNGKYIDEIGSEQAEDVWINDRM